MVYKKLSCRKKGAGSAIIINTGNVYIQNFPESRPRLRYK